MFKAQEEKIAAEQQFIDNSLNLLDGYAKEVTDRRQRRYDAEIQASQRHQDTLKMLAVRGNETAKENLALEEAREIQLQAKREKAIQRQKQLEAGLALIKTYSKNLDGTNNPLEALGKTVTEGAMLATILKSLPTFFVGTEDTGEAGDLDNKGGKLAILHPHERVMTAEQNKLTSGLDNWQLANAGMLYKKEITIANKDGFLNSEKILKKFDSLESAINNKPVYLGNEYHKDSHQLIEMVKTGNSLIKNHKTLSKLG